MRTSNSHGKRSPNWPMPAILTGVGILAAGVLLLIGLQSRDAQPTRTVARSSRPAATRALPAPDPVTEAPAVTVVAEPTPMLPAAEAQDPPAIEPAAAVPADFDAGESLFADARYGEAGAVFSAYVLQHADNPWGHYMLGLCQWKQGELDAAEGELEAAIDLAPELRKARLNLARVLMDAGRHDAALAEVEAVLEADPAAPGALRLRGRALANLGRPEAEQAYRAALVADPEDAWSLNNLGLLLVESERFEDALSVLALAVKLDGRVAVFQNNLGVALERCGHPVQAADAYAAALTLEPEHAKAALSLERVDGRRGPEQPLDLAARADETALALADGRLPWEATMESETQVTQLP